MQKVYKRKVSSQGQIAIPKALWEKLGLAEGQRRILIYVDDKGIHLKPVPDFMKWAGAFKPEKSLTSLRKGYKYPPLWEGENYTKLHSEGTDNQVESKRRKTSTKKQNPKAPIS